MKEKKRALLPAVPLEPPARCWQLAAIRKSQLSSPEGLILLPASRCKPTLLKTKRRNSGTRVILPKRFNSRRSFPTTTRGYPEAARGSGEPRGKPRAPRPFPRPPALRQTQTFPFSPQPSSDPAGSGRSRGAAPAQGPESPRHGGAGGDTGRRPWRQPRWRWRWTTLCARPARVSVCPCVRPCACARPTRGRAGQRAGQRAAPGGAPPPSAATSAGRAGKGGNSCKVKTEGKNKINKKRVF